MRSVLAITLAFSIAAAGCTPRANESGRTHAAPVDVTPTQANAFPPANGHELADRACQTCHSASLVTQQAKDSTAWEKTLGTMIKWGAQVDSTERDSLRDYLVREFGPRRAS